ncbi:MAG: CHAT domain-containing protein [Aurantibacter sp.]
MKYGFLIFFLTIVFCHAQDRHQELLSIINSDGEIEVRQQKIDSFLNVNENKLPAQMLADCYHDLGSKWYYSNWFDDEEVIHLKNAIAITEEAIVLKMAADSLDYDSLKKSLYNLGYFNYLEDNIFESIRVYNQLVDLGQDDRRTQNARVELGECYVNLGDFHKALSNLNEVRIFYENDPNNLQKLLDAHLGIAGTYSSMDYKEYSLEIKSNISKADSLLGLLSNDNVLYRERIDQIEGNRLLSIGKYEDALKYHLRTLTNSMDLPEADLARVYNSVAFSQMKLKKYELAKENLYKAISLDSTYTDPFENLGDWHIAQDQYQKGLFFYQKAIVYATDRKSKVIFDELLTQEKMELSGNKVSLLNHIVTKANGWLQYYEHEKDKSHLEHALATFALADQLVDIIRSESTEQQSKLFWREKGASLYMKAVEACYLLEQPERAYYFMERNKALLLLEDISNEQAKEIASLPDSIAKREFELKRAIYLSENELQNTETASIEKTNELKDRIYRNKRQYEQFADSLKVNFPNYANLKKKVDVLPYKNFRESFVSGDALVLQYILNDEQGYGLLSSRGETFFFELEDIDALNENIVDLYGRLTTLVSNREKMAELQKVSNSVFKELIPTEVYTLIKGKKLTIISDYILQQLPFETLVTNTESGSYLIEDTEIRYAYSMSYLHAKDQLAIRPGKELLGLAPVNFAALKLPDLAFSGEEILEAQEVFEGRVLLQEEATKQRLLENLNDYRIIHLSTHADIGEKQNHWIAFNDEKLFLNEVYANKNQADMVVLSACNTSLGELKKGEGVMSLARGFFHSGAKSVVSSLWTTNDKASKDIMTAFYQELGKGLTKSSALRNAKVDYIKKYRGTNISPAYWGALIIIGDNSAIQTAGLLGGYKIWLLGGILLLVVFFIIKRR